MTYSYNRGCSITFARDDGQPGPGVTYQYLMRDNFKVSVQDEGCVEVMFFGEPSITNVYPWHRIWEIKV
jgi:hypothetical protein